MSAADSTSGHRYDAVSGWCSCGHHRADGRQERDSVTRLPVAEIRDLLATTDHKENR